MDPERVYRGVFPVVTEVRGVRIYVGVHLATVGRRLRCVGLDLRSLNVEDVLLPGPMDLGNGDWVEIGSPVLRGLPLTDVLERALGTYRTYLDTVRSGMDEFEDEVGSSDRASSTRKRRGPRPQLDEGALERLVAPAYLMGGRRPVQAVRDELERSGALQPPVTLDQARKAVARARDLGLIPPARKPGAKHTREMPATDSTEQSEMPTSNTMEISEMSEKHTIERGEQ